MCGGILYNSQVPNSLLTLIREKTNLCHCFHTLVSVQILLAILEGYVPRYTSCWVSILTSSSMAYIHGENIVHRDLKPSNIFLSIRHRPSDNDNHIDISSCGQCGSDGPRATTFITPHIGDFGLAARIQEDQLGVSGGGVASAEPMVRMIQHPASKHFIEIKY